MGEKINGFINRERLPELRAVIHEKREGIKLSQDYVEVEITIIEPVYEYKLLLRKIDSDEIVLSVNHYINTDEYLSRHIAGFFEPIIIIEETKRIRK